MGKLIEFLILCGLCTFALGVMGLTGLLIEVIPNARY